MNTKIIAAAAVLAFAVFSFFCIRGHAPGIVADLAAKSSSALAAAGLNAVSVSANGRELSLAGLVPTDDDKARAALLVRDIPGVRRVTNALEVMGVAATATATAAPTVVAAATAAPVTPYEFRITRTPDAVTLNGLVPDSATRRQVLDQATRAFGSVQIQDEIEIAPGAPADWAQALTSIQSELSGYIQGDAYLSGQSIQVRGEVPADRNTATTRLAAALPSHYNADINLSMPVQQASACQAALDQQLAGNRINFAVSSATISNESLALLDRLADTLRGCSAIRVQVSGHTDSQGAAAANVALSQRRAEAVVNYLVAAGIAGQQLAAQGFGETQPISGNETWAGRARNRRIEFTVLGTER